MNNAQEIAKLLASGVPQSQVITQPNPVAEALKTIVPTYQSGGAGVSTNPNWQSGANEAAMNALLSQNTPQQAMMPQQPKQQAARMPQYGAVSAARGSPEWYSAFNERAANPNSGFGYTQDPTTLWQQGGLSEYGQTMGDNTPLNRYSAFLGKDGSYYNIGDLSPVRAGTSIFGITERQPSYMNGRPTGRNDNYVFGVKTVV